MLIDHGGDAADFAAVARLRAETAENSRTAHREVARYGGAWWEGATVVLGFLALR